MDNVVAKQLKTLIDEYGTRICNEPGRCRGLLLDLCGEYKKEIRVLQVTMELGVPQLLLSLDDIPYKLQQAKLVKRLIDEYAITENAGNWSIDAWAYALGIKDTLPQDRLSHAIKKDVVIRNGMQLSNTGDTATSTNNRSSYPKYLSLMDKSMKRSNKPNASGRVLTNFIRGLSMPNFRNMYQLFIDAALVFLPVYVSMGIIPYILEDKAILISNLIIDNTIITEAALVIVVLSASIVFFIASAIVVIFADMPTIGIFISLFAYIIVLLNSSHILELQISLVSAIIFFVDLPRDWSLLIFWLCVMLIVYFILYFDQKRK